jgi:hypothetical protein
MHPILSQALVAERVREWEHQAARHRLAKQLRRGEREAARVAGDRPGPGRGPRWSARRGAQPSAAVPDTRPSQELVAVPDGKRGTGDDRRQAGERAA